MTRNVVDVLVCARRFVMSFRARNVDVVGTRSRTDVVDAIVSDVVVVDSIGLVAIDTTMYR